MKVEDATQSEIATYAYDQFGRRIKKNVSQTASVNGSTGTSGITIFIYGDEGLMAEVDNTGTITTIEPESALGQ